MNLKCDIKFFFNLIQIQFIINVIAVFATKYEHNKKYSKKE